jgi:hypothetical protein
MEDDAHPTSVRPGEPRQADEAVLEYRPFASETIPDPFPIPSFAVTAGPREPAPPGTHPPGYGDVGERRRSLGPPASVHYAADGRARLFLGADPLRQEEPPTVVSYRTPAGTGTGCVTVTPWSPAVVLLESTARKTVYLDISP